MHDDRIIELADSYVAHFMTLTDRADVQTMLRIIALRAALLEVQNIHGSKNDDG